jgi:hypothetical protein
LCSFLTLPEARADRFVEIALSDEVTLCIDSDRKLRKWASGWAEDDLATID